MQNALATTEKQQVSIPEDVSIQALEMAVGQGDFSRFTPADKLRYLTLTCRTAGLNPLTLPIRIIKMDGREVMYATAECSAQLSYRDKVSVKKTSQIIDNDTLIITVVASTPNGRSHEDIGAIPLVYPATTREWVNGQSRTVNHPKAGKRLEGLDYANALKKCHTQATRRSILRLCSLAIMDESEIPDSAVQVNLPNAVEAAVEASASSIADKLNASLTSTEKSKAVDVEIIPTTPPAPKAEAPPVATAAPIEAAAPASETSPFEEPKPVEPPKQPEASPHMNDADLQLSVAINEYDDKRFTRYTRNDAVAFLVSKGKIQKGQPITEMPQVAKDWILRNPPGFHKLVDDWVGGGRK